MNDHADAIGGDAARISIGGDSAGGALAVVTLLRARSSGQQMPIFQLLFAPTLDLTMNSPSWKELGDKHYVLDTDTVKQYFNWYVSAGVAKTDPDVSPVFAPDFSGMPPALIIVGSADPQRDEAKTYADKLTAAGVPATVKEYPGAMHGFYQMAAVFDKGKAALADAATALREAAG